MTSVSVAPAPVADHGSPRAASAPGMRFTRWRVTRDRIAPWLAGVIVLAIGIGALAVDRYPVGVVHDDAMYVILAKALATGQGYRWIHLPGAPSATHFPPGYPILLALLWRIGPAFPANVLLFKVVNVLCLAGTAVLIARLAQRRAGMSPPVAAVVAVVATGGIPLLTLAVIVMSEPLFLLCAVALLLRIERMLDDDTISWRQLVVLGVGVGIATLVRSHGIALIGAVVLVLAVRRRWRDALLFGAPAALVLAPWQLFMASNQGRLPWAMRGNYESYGAWLAQGYQAEGPALLVRTIARTSGSAGGMLRTLFAPGLPWLVQTAALACLLALTVAGVVHLRRRLPATVTFLTLYTAIVLCWPFTPARFLWAVWPLYLLLPVAGGIAARRAAGATPGRTRLVRSSLVTAAVLMLVAGHALYTVRGFRGAWWTSIPRATANLLRPSVVWIRGNTRPTDIVATDGEGMVYLYTGRRTVPVQTFTVAEYFRPRAPQENAAAMQSILAAYPVDVVTVTSGAMWLATRELATSAHPILAPRDTFPGGLVLYPTSR